MCQLAIEIFHERVIDSKSDNTKQLVKTKDEEDEHIADQASRCSETALLPANIILRVSITDQVKAF